MLTEKEYITSKNAGAAKNDTRSVQKYFSSSEHIIAKKIAFDRKRYIIRTGNTADAQQTNSALKMFLPCFQQSPRQNKTSAMLNPMQ